MPSLRRLVACGWVVLAASAGSAQAEIVFLSTGRTLSVQSHRIDGATATLVLRAGGEVAFPASLIVRVEPDEVAPPPAPAIDSTAAEPAATVQQPLTGPYAALIERAASRHAVDPRLVHAVIRAESNFRPRARSRRGARGLMQLMPSTLRQYAVDNPYDPRENIEAGTRHLRGLLDRFALKDALAAYNAGQRAVVRYGGVPPFAETTAYVSRILSDLSLPPAVGPSTSYP